MNSSRARLLYLIVAGVLGTALVTACSPSSAALDTADVGAASGAAAADSSGERCVDSDASNPTLRQIYEGFSELMVKTAIDGGSSDTEVESIREGNSPDSVLGTLLPDQIAQQEQILANIPPGGYGRYVQAVCDVEEAFQGPPPTTRTPWATAFDGVIICSSVLSLPASERESYARSTEQSLRAAGNISEGFITYTTTKTSAAFEYLCPQ